jgi:hypothetical protein
MVTLRKMVPNSHLLGAHAHRLVLTQRPRTVVSRVSNQWRTTHPRCSAVHAAAPGFEKALLGRLFASCGVMDILRFRTLIRPAR